MKQTMKRWGGTRAVFFPFLILGIFITTSCQYQLGRGSAHNIQSIAIKPVLNETQIPQFEPLLDAQLRERLIKSGIQIRPEGSADAILEVRVTQYDRDLSSVRSDDSGLALSYGLDIGVEITLSRPDGALLLDRAPVRIHRETFVEDGAQVAEYQTLPVIARDLAVRIQRRILDTW